jgi:hypothetical protein
MCGATPPLPQLCCYVFSVQSYVPVDQHASTYLVSTYLSSTSLPDYKDYPEKIIVYSDKKSSGIQEQRTSMRNKSHIIKWTLSVITFRYIQWPDVLLISMALTLIIFNILLHQIFITALIYDLQHYIYHIHSRTPECLIMWHAFWPHNTAWHHHVMWMNLHDSRTSFW